MQKQPLNIGIVGYGFMGRTHANAYNQAPRFFDLPRQPVLKAVCGRDQAKAQAYADNWGFESLESDWRPLIERKDIDTIDICTPNNSHADVATAAARPGKMGLAPNPPTPHAPPAP